MLFPPIPDLLLYLGLGFGIYWLYKNGKLGNPPASQTPAVAKAPPPPTANYVPAAPPPMPPVQYQEPRISAKLAEPAPIPVSLVDEYNLLGMPLQQLLDHLKKVEKVRAVLLSEIEKLKSEEGKSK